MTLQKLPFMRSSAPTIAPGASQPMPCKTCKAKHGYDVARYVQLQQIDEYAAGGKHTKSEYTDHYAQVYVAKRTYCIKCGRKLPFRVEED